MSIGRLDDFLANVESHRCLKSSFSSAYASFRGDPKCPGCGTRPASKKEFECVQCGAQLRKPPNKTRHHTKRAN